MKDLNEIRNEISQTTGIPTELLMQDNAENCLKAAKTMMDLKKRFDDSREKTTQEQFGEWFNAGNEETSISLEGLEEEVRQITGAYPRVKDSGEVSDMPDGRSTVEKFDEWFGKKTATYNFPDAWFIH